MRRVVHSDVLEEAGLGRARIRLRVRSSDSRGG